MSDASSWKRGAPPARDVEHAPGQALASRREEVRVDHVVDVNEVPALRAVSEEGDRTPAEDAVHEDADHARIGRARVLPGAEHVEVAERYRLDLKQLAPCRQVVLSGDLLDTVRRYRQRAHRLDLREGRFVAINRRGGSKDDALDPRLASRLQDVEGPLDVDVVRLLGMLDAVGDADDGCFVEDHVAPGRALLDRREVTDVGLDEANPVGDGVQIRPRAGEEVVEHDDFVARLDEPMRDVRPYEPGSSGDERPHDAGMNALPPGAMQAGRLCARGTRLG